MSFCEQIERRDYIWLSACPVVANAAYEQLQLSGRTGRMVNVGCGMRDAAMIWYQGVGGGPAPTRHGTTHINTQQRTKWR